MCVLKDIEAAGKKLQAREHLLPHPNTAILEVGLMVIPFWGWF